MHRIDGPGATVTNRFTDGDPLTGVVATVVTDDWLNDVQEELISILAAAGITPAKGAQNQILAALRLLGTQSPVLSDIGSVNAYRAANAFPLNGTTLVNGTRQRVIFGTTNTGASSYQADATPAFPIYGLNNSPLQGGEILANSIGYLVFSVSAVINSGNGAWVLTDLIGAPQQVAPATKSQHAMQLGQATGRLAAMQVFASSGTYTPTTGMVSVIFRMVGGGGAGGGLTTPSAGNISMGAPGSSGSYAEGRFLAAAIGASQAVTVGAGGVAVVNASGGAGGSSSVGSLMTAPGGPGGSILNNQVPGVSNGNGTPAGTPTGANIVQSIGNCTKLCTSSSASSGQPGGGGDSIFGPGAIPPILNGPGIAALNYGAGGSGVVAGSGGTAQKGGDGKSGIVIAYEYF